MTYTIEDVKRLIPEAKIRDYGDGTFSFTVTGKDFLSPYRGLGLLLLTTRRQLEIARSELNTIATQDDIEMVLDPTWAKRIAEHALAVINKEGEA